MIIESMGGKMTGASEQGRGTTMVISLPLYACEDDPANCVSGEPVLRRRTGIE
jgi:hypothetical protein